MEIWVKKILPVNGGIFFAKSFAELSLKILVLKTLIQYICAGN